MNNPENYLAYSDEAGDEGDPNKSGRYFINSAVIVRETEEPNVRSYEDQCFEKIWRQKGRTPPSLLHWRKLSDRNRLQISSILGTKEYVQIAILLDKTKLPYMRRKLFYDFTARLLLERITWFVDDRGGRLKKIVFSQRSGITENKIRQAVNGYLAEPDNSIRRIFNVTDIHVIPMQNYIMLRAADNVTSALFNSLCKNTNGVSKSHYFDNLHHRLYRYRDHNRIWKYGLKIFPCENGKKGFDKFIQEYPHAEDWFK